MHAATRRQTMDTTTFAKKLHELHLPDNDVSRKHARLAWKEEAGAYHVRDLNSTNGVKLNGVRIKPYEEAPLAKGDKIELGQSTFEIRLKDAVVYKWQAEDATKRELARRKAEEAKRRKWEEDKAKRKKFEEAFLRSVGVPEAAAAAESD